MTASVARLVLTAPLLAGILLQVRFEASDIATLDHAENLIPEVIGRETLSLQTLPTRGI